MQGSQISQLTLLIQARTDTLVTSHVLKKSVGQQDDEY